MIALKVVISCDRCSKTPPVETTINVRVEKPGVFSASPNCLPEGWGRDRHGHILCPPCDAANLYDY